MHISKGGGVDRIPFSYLNFDLPIKNGSNIATIGECHESRAIPGLHGTSSPAVKVSLLLVHETVILPSLGDHCHDSLKDVMDIFISLI